MTDIEELEDLQPPFTRGKPKSKGPYCKSGHTPDRAILASPCADCRQSFWTLTLLPREFHE